MAPEVDLLSRGVIAVQAFKGPLPGVNAQVPLQVDGRTEISLADFTIGRDGGAAENSIVVLEEVVERMTRRTKKEKTEKGL